MLSPAFIYDNNIDGIFLRVETFVSQATFCSSIKQLPTSNDRALLDERLFKNFQPQSKNLDLFVPSLRDEPLRGKSGTDESCRERWKLGIEVRNSRKTAKLPISSRRPSAPRYYPDQELIPFSKVLLNRQKSKKNSNSLIKAQKFKIFDRWILAVVRSNDKCRPFLRVRSRCSSFVTALAFFFTHNVLASFILYTYLSIFEHFDHSNRYFV